MWQHAAVPRYAILVDAGYLLMAGASSTLGASERAEAVVAYEGLIRWLIDKADGDMGDLGLLRLYWYDASPQKLPQSEHLTVAEQPDTKLRLGYLTQGGQKGVDALIFADLLELARCGAVSDVILVAGDGDHVEAVERAQALGVRVHLWGVDTTEGSVSLELRRCADRAELLGADGLRPFFQRAPAPPAVRPAWMDVPDSPPPSRPPATLRTYASVDPADARLAGAHFATGWRQLATPAQVLEVQAAHRPSIPQSVDGRLLRFACEELRLSAGAELSPEARIEIREGFWDALDAGTT